MATIGRSPRRSDLGPEPSSWELLARSFLPNSQLPLTLAQFGGQLLRRGLTLAGMEHTPPIPGSAPKVRWNAVVGPRRSVAFASVSLDDVRAVKAAADVKVNDVILALAAGTMAAYLRDHDELPDQSLIASVPVSVRGEGDDELGNQISNMMVSLATHEDDPAARLQAIAESSRGAKEMTAALQARKIQSLGETAPPLVLNQAIRALHRGHIFSAIPTVANTIISNVPGPPIPLYLAGARVTGIYPGSIITDAMGLNVTVISYVDRVDFGYAADPDLVPDLLGPGRAPPGRDGGAHGRARSRTGNRRRGRVTQ
ncbi:MAG: WS/DGAT domain-containing protein [Acidimicrobiales bacterium]